MAMVFDNLRVAVVGPIPPPAGGMANQTKALVDALQEEGAKPVLIAVNRPVRPNFIGRVPVVRALWRLPIYCLELVRQLRDAQIVHVLANSGLSWYLFAVPAVWIAAALRRPVIVNYRGGLAEEFFARSWRWVKPTIDMAAAVAVPSPYLQTVFKRFGVEAIEVPNIIDLHRFANNEKRKPDGPRIIITRNLESIYGIDTALKAFAEIRKAFPNAKLLVAGSGPKRVALETLSRELGVESNIEFLGRLDLDEIARLYAGADLMINPSRVDNSPNSIIEAMAAKVPIVTTDAGGIPFIVEDRKHVLMVPIDDFSAMADAALYVLQDGKASYEMCNNAYDLVQKYTWQNVRTCLNELYVGVLR